MSLVELPSGGHAILRKHVTMGGRNRIQAAELPPADLLEVMAQIGAGGDIESLSPDERKALERAGVVQMPAIREWELSKKVTRVVEWVESWTFDAPVTAAACEELEEPDWAALLAAVLAVDPVESKPLDLSPTPEADSPTNG